MKVTLSTLVLSSFALCALSFQPSSTTVILRNDISLNQSSQSMDFVATPSRKTMSMPPSTSTEDLLKTFSESPAPPSKNPLKDFSESYSRLTREHYLPMAFLQAGFLASGADMATQYMESGSIEFGHVAAMASVASTMSGAMNAIWLRQLEDAFPGTGTKEVVSKTMIHAVILASIINSAYLVGVPLFHDYFFTGSFQFPPIDSTVIFQGWTLDEFITLTKLEILMFIPYNTLAFKFVPPSIRPLTHASISATFNIAVSAITLGYFNLWCERATSIFS